MIIYVPTQGATDWKQFLAEPEKQWKDGFSAKELAQSWEAAADFPVSVARVLRTADEPDLREMKTLLAIPEYKVHLTGGSRPSQNDLFVLARTETGLAVIMVEGKVSESFGPTLNDWLVDASHGKLKRLDFLKQTLGLNQEVPGTIRYQLLHRTASAVLTAREFHAKYALMLVHSFSKEMAGFEDYAAFLQLYNVKAVAEKLQRVMGGEVPVSCGWVKETLFEQ